LVFEEWNRDVELRDYLNVIRARKWIIIQAVIIVTLTAVVVSLFQAPTYQGEARVLISDRDAGAAIFGTALGDLSAQPERGLQTQVQLMQLRPLAETVVRKLGLQESPESLLLRVTVTGIGQTNVVTIVATDGDPKRAAEIANAMGDAYVEWSKQSKRESIKSAADEVQTRLDDARTQILELGRKISAQGKSDELSAELTIATGLYTTLAEKLETLLVNEQLEIGAGRVVSAAVADPVAVSPKPVRNGALGLAVGLMFGLGMAFLLEYLDNTIKSTDEAEKLYGAPVLGHIPEEYFEKGEKRRLSIVQHPGSPAAESYRVLRNSLDFVNFQHDIQVLLVTSSAPGEGKSTVAANLAAGLSQAGKKVVLVNSDFRRPTTDQFFNINNIIGLSDVLTGSNSLKSALQRPGDEQLLVLSSGKMPPNPSELLGSQKMADLIESLKEWADWVVVDSPPLLAVADAAAIARWADGVLMVTRGGVSTREAARKGREMLEKVGARIIGVAVWGLEETAGGKGYGYYYDGLYGGYNGGYYYYGYYTPTEQGRSKKKNKGVPVDSGAKGPVIEIASPREVELYIPEKSTGRKVAEFIGRLMAGVLAFVVVLVIISVIFYFADLALGWGLVPTLTKTLGLG
jgi:capsular exopolysaccharide synthesis family protein